VLIIAAARQSGVPGADTVAITGIGMVSVGAGLGIAAALLYFTRETPLRNTARSVSFDTDGRSATLGLRWTF
jgi:hypothetical protein